MQAKNLILPALIFSIMIFGATVYASKVKADDDASLPPFIQSLAEHFNLNQDEVKSFLGEQRQQQQQQRQQQMEENLQKAVDDGVITAQQKDAISAKQQENVGQRQQNRQEMDQWFKDQGIDHDALASYLRPDDQGKGMGMRSGGHHSW